MTTHGHRGVVNGKRISSPTYAAWRRLNAYCNNKNNIHYADYGGRGITVCERWRRFENFLEDMGVSPGREFSIDRIDNNGGYSKENCRWATYRQQQRNRRSNRLITLNGVTKTCMEWAEDYGIPPSRLYNRLWWGWEPERALTEPPSRRTKAGA